MQKFILILIASSLLASPAWGAAFGVSLGLSAGEGEVDNNSNFDFDVFGSELSFAAHIGAQENTFNYRLNVGIGGGESEDQSTERTISEFDGLQINNTFSFKLVQTGIMRLWLGPTATLSFLEVDPSNGLASEDAVLFGLGPTLGIDLDFAGNAPMLSFELGYQRYALTYDDDFIDDEEGDLIIGRVTLLWGD